MKKVFLSTFSVLTLTLAGCSSETTEDLETAGVEITRSNAAPDSDGNYICDKRGEQCLFVQEHPEGWTGNKLRQHNGDAYEHYHCIDPECPWYYNYFETSEEGYTSHINKSETSQGAKTGAGHGGNGGVE